MADMKLAQRLSDAFGPSGYEEDVVALLQGELKEFDTEKDPMHNLYIRRKKAAKAGTKPVVMLDAHTDEVGFMVQAVRPNGLLRLVPLGGWVDSNIPAHTFWIRNRRGELVKAVTSSKPPHFMSPAERAATITLDNIFLDVGATTKEEVVNDFAIEAGCPVGPDVTFSYDEKHDMLFGKAFDNRIGCLCVTEVMRRVNDDSLDVEPVGALASQEEVGTRGAHVTAQTVKPKIAIVFEGSPSDDFFVDKAEAQGIVKGGVQIRYRDNSMVANNALIEYARGLADQNKVKYQCTVRTGGGTNAGPIHLSNEGIPTLVLGIPVRYAHTHYCFCAGEDVDAAVELATLIVKDLSEEKMKKVFD